MSEEQAPYQADQLPSSKEDLILQAARCVFHRNGSTGARMQEIAEEAGVNQALIHYYFRNKENLFQAVFEADLLQFFAVQAETLSSNEDLKGCIRSMVHNHMDMLGMHPYLPAFVIGEIFSQPERLDRIMQQKSGMGIVQAFYEKVAQAEAAGQIRPTDPVQLITTILGSCIHAFIAKPMIQRAHDMDEDAYHNYLETRREFIPDLIWRGIALDNAPAKRSETT